MYLIEISRYHIKYNYVIEEGQQAFFEISKLDTLVAFNLWLSNNEIG